jgi:hypothetical protein
MASHPEHTGKPSDSKPSEEGASPSKAELIRIKLKLISHYAVIGFAPIMATLALTLAIVAIVGNQSARTALSDGAPKFESMNSSLAAYKGELEKIKVAMAQDKTLQEDERKKLDEKIDKIIQSVSQLQVKMKISPTLEEQLRQPASAPVAATPAAITAASAPAATPAKTATPVAPPKPVEKKFSPQVQSMKEAIEKYNKQ